MVLENTSAAGRRSDLWVSAAVLLMVCLVTGASLFVGWRALNPPAKPTSQARSNDELVKKGDRISHPSVVSGGESTIVLILSSSCVYCTRSVPFYQELVATVNAERLPVSVLAAGSEPPSTLHAYLDIHKLDLAVIEFDSLGIRTIGTPTVLYLDALGVVQGVWAGLLNSEQQIELWGALRSAAE